MIRLGLLGGVDVRDAAGRSLNGDIGGPKYLALLVYLVLEGAERPVRRDSVVGVLWPDVEQKKARASLSQGLTQLKSILGDVVIPNGQEELAIDRDRITADCFAYAELASAGQLEEAVALYRGDVARGFILKDAPEFEQWLSVQQTAWRDRHADVIQKLTTAALESGDPGHAVTWAEHLIDIAPDREDVIHAVLQALVQRAQSAAAKRVYDKHARALAEAYGTTPSAEITALVGALPQAIAPPRANPASTFQIGQPVSRRRGRLVTALGVVAIALSGIAAFVWYDSSRTQVAAYEISAPRVAVVPFTADESARRSANVLNEALQWRLRSAGFQVLNAGGPDNGAVQKLAARDIAFIIGGDVANQPDGSLATRMWLEDAGTGKRVWQSRFAQPQSEAHLIATQLSDAITAQIRRAVGSVLELAPGTDKVSPESWKAAYRARERIEAAIHMRWQGAHAGSAAELQDAEHTLIEVTKREPAWALPWVLRGRVAEARGMTALLAGDTRAGAQALDGGIRLLDSVAPRLRSQDVYEMRGLLEFRRYVFGVDDVATAERLLSRAEADLRKAVAPGRDPSGAYTMLSGVMFAQGKYAESFVYARRAYDSNVFLRNNEELLTRLFNSAFHAGDDASADYWCKEMQNVLSGNWPSVLCRIHIAGFAPARVDVASLQREIASMAAPPPVRKMMEPRLKAAYAITLAQLGRTDSARATLAAVSDSKDPEVMLFRTFALAALADTTQANTALRSYLAQDRGTRSTALHMRWLDQGSQIQMPLTR